MNGGLEATMDSFSSLPAAQPYVISLLVLGLNLVGLANATAVSRGQAREVINPEDQRSVQALKVVFDDGNEVTARYRRAHRNALENTPLFLVPALALTLLGTSATLAGALFYAFAVLRVVHSVCYVKGLQPVRTIAFALSLLVQVAVLGIVVYRVLAPSGT